MLEYRASYHVESSSSQWLVWKLSLAWLLSRCSMDSCLVLVCFSLMCSLHDLVWTTILTLIAPVFAALSRDASGLFVWHLHTFIMIKNGFHCRASSIPRLSFCCIYPLGQDGKWRKARRGRSRERTKSGCFSARQTSLKWMKEESLSIKDWSALLNYHHSTNHACFFTNQRPSITGNRSSEYPDM